MSNISRRHLLLLSGATALLGGCGDLLGPPDAPQIYVMRPHFDAPAALPAHVGWSLGIMRPAAPGALDSDRIAIIQPDARMDYYANAAYPDRLPSLVETAVLTAFEANGALDSVARNAEAMHADYLLFLDIKDFQARYAVADGVPEAQVTLTARLATARGRIQKGIMTISRSVPAAANSVPAATAALQQALSEAALAIVAWAQTFPAPPAPPVGQ